MKRVPDGEPRLPSKRTLSTASHVLSGDGIAISGFKNDVDTHQNKKLFSQKVER